MLKNLRSFVQLIFCIVYPISIVAMDIQAKKSSLKKFHYFKELPDDLQKKILCDCISNTNSLQQLMKTIENLSCVSKKFNRYLHTSAIQKQIFDFIEQHLVVLHNTKKEDLATSLLSSTHYSLLDTAIECDLISWVQRYFKKNRADINAKKSFSHLKGTEYYNPDSTVLHQAAVHNAHKVTAFFLKKFPCELNQLDGNGYTALQVGCIHKSFETAELLLLNGANPEPDNYHPNVTSLLTTQLTNHADLSIKENKIVYEKISRLLQLTQRKNPSCQNLLTIGFINWKLFLSHFPRIPTIPLLTFSALITAALSQQKY